MRRHSLLHLGWIYATQLTKKEKKGCPVSRDVFWFMACDSEWHASYSWVDDHQNKRFLPPTPASAATHTAWASLIRSSLRLSSEATKRQIPNVINQVEETMFEVSASSRTLLSRPQILHLSSPMSSKEEAEGEGHGVKGRGWVPDDFGNRRLTLSLEQIPAKFDY